LQAQDFQASLWALGIRSGATKTLVEEAFTSGGLVRGWPMRGTLHVVASEDIGWITALNAPRLTAESALKRRHGQLGLTASDINQAHSLIEDILSGGRSLSRDDLADEMTARGFVWRPGWKYHITWFLAQTGILVFGPIKEGEHHLVLADEWIARPRRLEGAEAWAELASRYVASHGPATEEDLTWWAGAPKRLVREGLADAGDRVAAVPGDDGRTYWVAPDLLDEDSSQTVRTVPSVLLTPAFDEYLLGYSDRTAMLPSRHVQAICPGNNGIFKPTVLVDGVVSGVWQGAPPSTLRRLKPDQPVPISVHLFEDTAQPDQDSAVALQQAVDAYALFLSAYA
jgi:hypothetical protein